MEPTYLKRTWNSRTMWCDLMTWVSLLAGDICVKEVFEKEMEHSYLKRNTHQMQPCFLLGKDTLDPSSHAAACLDCGDGSTFPCNTQSGINHFFNMASFFFVSFQPPGAWFGLWTLSPRWSAVFPFKSRDFRFRWRHFRFRSHDFWLSPPSIWSAVFTSLATTLATPATNQKPSIWAKWAPLTTLNRRITFPARTEPLSNDFGYFH